MLSVMIMMIVALLIDWLLVCLAKKQSAQRVEVTKVLSACAVGRVFVRGACYEVFLHCIEWWWWR